MCARDRGPGCPPCDVITCRPPKIRARRLSLVRHAEAGKEKVLGAQFRACESSRQGAQATATPTVVLPSSIRQPPSTAWGPGPLPALSVWWRDCCFLPDSHKWNDRAWALSGARGTFFFFFLNPLLYTTMYLRQRCHHRQPYANLYMRPAKSSINLVDPQPSYFMACCPKPNFTHMGAKGECTSGKHQKNLIILIVA